MNRIAIVGAGECGVRAAFALREMGYDGEVTVLGDEQALPYERPPLSKNIGTPPKHIRSPGAYRDARIDLQLGSRVASIDLETQSLMRDDGMSESYDRLLLALGSRARLFPGMENCITMRTDADAAFILGRIEKGTRLGIIGGGFIGLELAATARGAGADVIVFEAAPRLLGRAVPEKVSAVVHARHIAGGVDIRTGVGVRSATASSIDLANGDMLDFDLVVAGVGSAPNAGLAEAAGLQVTNGIVVDEAFRTSASNIFAAGDCCNFPWRGQRIRLESWKAAQDQGAHVAAAMLGEPPAYNKIPWFWSDQYDLSLQVVGLFDHAREVHTRQGSGDALVVFQLDGEGRLGAAAGIGPGSAAAKEIKLLEKLMERHQPVDAATLSNPDTNLKSLLKAA